MNDRRHRRTPVIPRLQLAWQPEVSQTDIGEVHVAPCPTHATDDPFGHTLERLLNGALRMGPTRSA